MKSLQPAAVSISAGTTRGRPFTALLGLALFAACRQEPPHVPASAPETPVTAESLQRPSAFNSPALAVDPTDGRFVALAARADSPDFGCMLALSGDGGRGWVPAPPLPNLPREAEKCYAPEVAFDARGTLFFSFVGLRGSGNHPIGLYLMRSSDRGRTFEPPRRVLSGRTYMTGMAVDKEKGRRNVHFAYVQAASEPATAGFLPEDNPVMAISSPDGGRTFSKPVRVSDPKRQRVVAPALAITPQGAVHVVFYDLRDDARDYQGVEGPRWEGRWSLVSSSSRNGGRTFGQDVVVTDDIVPPERIMVIFTAAPPSLLSDRGNLFVSWADARRGDPDVYLSASRDGGRKWGGPRRVNDDHPGKNVSQHLPRLSGSGSRLDVLFYDRRNDPGNVETDVYLASSRNGGRGFSPNVRVSSQSFDSRIGVTYAVLPSARGLFEFGSRIGLAAGPRSAIAAWTDTRNFSAEQVVQQNIFARRVDLAEGTGARG